MATTNPLAAFAAMNRDQFSLLAGEAQNLYRQNKCRVRGQTTLAHLGTVVQSLNYDFPERDYSQKVTDAARAVLQTLIHSLAAAAQNAIYGRVWEQRKAYEDTSSLSFGSDYVNRDDSDPIVLINALNLEHFSREAHAFMEEAKKRQLFNYIAQKRQLLHEKASTCYGAWPVSGQRPLTLMALAEYTSQRAPSYIEDFLQKATSTEIQAVIDWLELQSSPAGAGAGAGAGSSSHAAVASYKKRAIEELASTREVSDMQTMTYPPMILKQVEINTETGETAPTIHQSTVYDFYGDERSFTEAATSLIMDNTITSEILPGLHIGGYKGTSKVGTEFQANLHVTTKSSQATDSSLVKEYHVGDVSERNQTADSYLEMLSGDRYNQGDVSTYFADAFELMDEALAERKPLLVNCSVGESRSVTLVAAYLMSRFGVSRNQALIYIKTKRAGAEPVPMLFNLLGRYESMLRGERPTSPTPRVSPHAATIARMKNVLGSDETSVETLLPAYFNRIKSDLILAAISLSDRSTLSSGAQAIVERMESHVNDINGAEYGDMLGDATSDDFLEVIEAVLPTEPPPPPAGK